MEMLLEFKLFCQYFIIRKSSFSIFDGKWNNFKPRHCYDLMEICFQHVFDLLVNNSPSVILFIFPPKILFKITGKKN